MASAEKKILIMGDGGVGKSCLVNRFVGNGFPDEYDATIFDKYRHDINVDGQRITVELHDTAGQEEFKALWDDWILDGDAMVLVYSVSKKESFQIIVEKLHKLIQRTREDDHTSIPIALCGNKCDLDESLHEVDPAEAQEYARQHGWGWCEVSAKTNHQVSLPFQHVARELLKEPAVAPTKSKGICTIL